MSSVAPRYYNEFTIGRALARFGPFRSNLCIVDNCYWPGNECDLLVVTPHLRVIDVEIKVSRSDFKADRHKDKWRSIDTRTYPWGFVGPRVPPPPPRDWPRRVWKHYYVVAHPIWEDSMLDHINPMSGVMTIKLDEFGNFRHCTVKRRVKARKDYKPLTPEQVIDIARLASVRLWSAYSSIRDSVAQQTPGTDLESSPTLIEPDPAD